MQAGEPNFSPHIHTTLKEPFSAALYIMRRVPLEREINIAVNGCSGFATSTQKGPFMAMLTSCSRGTYLIHHPLSELIINHALIGEIPITTNNKSINPDTATMGASDRGNGAKADKRTRERGRVGDWTHGTDFRSRRSPLNIGFWILLLWVSFIALDLQACAKEMSSVFPSHRGQPMHSQSALTELPSPT